MKHIEIAALVILTGCAVGPNYRPPQTSVAGSFANTPTNAVAGDEVLLATWWSGFQDATLSNLIANAIAHNHNLRIATANLKEARALRRLAVFDLAPTVQGSAGYSDFLLSKAAAPPGTPRHLRQSELYDAGFDATWEIDLFGRVRRSVQAANAGLAATEATRLDVLVSVVAEVARNYFELRGQQNQLAVARQNADVQTETLKVTQARLEGGRGTDFDVSRSRSLLNLTLSSIPPLEGGIQKTIHQLAVLTGRQPTVLTALQETEDALVDFGKEQTRQQFLQESAEASQKASDLAHQRYEAGAADFLSVLDAERTLLDAQDRLAASQTRTATALVAVYKALGGGIPVTDTKR